MRKWERPLQKDIFVNRTNVYWWRGRKGLVWPIQPIFNAWASLASVRDSVCRSLARRVPCPSTARMGPVAQQVHRWYCTGMFMPWCKCAKAQCTQFVCVSVCVCVYVCVCVCVCMSVTMISWKLPKTKCWQDNILYLIHVVLDFWWRLCLQFIV